MTPYLFLAGFVGVLYVMFAWWSEVVSESHVGDHTPVVRIGLRYGFILFIMSEVMFFAAWFWSFFKHAMYPMNEYVGSRVRSARDLPGRPVAPAADQHADPAAVGLCRDMGAPRAGAREQPQGPDRRVWPSAIVLGVAFTVSAGL